MSCEHAMAVRLAITYSAPAGPCAPSWRVPNPTCLTTEPIGVVDLSRFTGDGVIPFTGVAR